MGTLTDLVLNPSANDGTSSYQIDLIKQYIQPHLEQDSNELRKRTFESPGGAEVHAMLENLTNAICEIKNVFSETSTTLGLLAKKYSNNKADGGPDGDYIEHLQPTWTAIEKEFDDLLWRSMLAATTGASHAKVFREVMVPLLQDEAVPLDTKKKSLRYFVKNLDETCKNAQAMSAGFHVIPFHIELFSMRLNEAVKDATGTIPTRIARLMKVNEIKEQLSATKFLLLETLICIQAMRILDQMNLALISPTDIGFRAYTQIATPYENLEMLLVEYVSKVMDARKLVEERKPTMGPVADGYYTLYCVSSHTVVDLAWAGTHEGNSIHNHQINHSAAQEWKLTRKPDGTYEIMSSIDEKIFMGYSNGEHGESMTARYSPSQWTLTQVGGQDDTFFLSSPNGLVLDLCEANAADGTPLELHYKHGGTNQQWKLELAI